MSAHYDIAVVGAGPAGGNAALAAAAQGLRVALIDEQPKVGGQVWRAKSDAILSAPQTPETQAGDALRSSIAQSSITTHADSRVWQIARENDNWHLQILKASTSQTLRARSLILASGAREFVHPIAGWTTPGVVGLAGATALFKQNLIPPGKRTIVSGTGPLVFYVASEIRRLGGEVAAVVTPNTRRDWARAFPSMLMKPKLLARGAVWVADLMLARVPIFWGHCVTSVDGDTAVSAVSISPLSSDWTPHDKRQNITADSLCLGNGLSPQVEAAQMLGVEIEHRPELGGWIPKSNPDGSTDVPDLLVCGDGCGIRGADAAVVHGQLVGLRAAQDHGINTAAQQTRVKSKWDRATRFGLAMTALSIPREGIKTWATPATILCRCESITKQAIIDELKAGAASTNAVKSGLRAGMGPCAGKYCQTAIANLIADQTGAQSAPVAPPTPRPPLRPVLLSGAAGTFDYDDLAIPKPAPL